MSAEITVGPCMYTAGPCMYDVNAQQIDSLLNITDLTITYS